MKVDVELTRKLAKLSRLKLTEEETNAFTDQIGKIVDYVDLLQEARVDGVEPLFYPSLTGPDAKQGMSLRKDLARTVVKETVVREAVSQESETEYYRVPQVV
jgi:aspartyl-tRNA(Asn)/glutamyl-tRNA(Gln) amidotransferase subunit C